MKVSRLQLGVYNINGNQQPFCLYLFPLVASSQNDHDISPRTTIFSPFYRLRDIDFIFFESSTDFLFKSGKVPQIYFDTPGYCFYERSGDIFLAARAVGETATRLGNHLLAEYCKYEKEDIISGMADRLLNDVPLLTRMFPPAEAEFEFYTVDSPVSHLHVLPPISSPPRNYASSSPVGSPTNNDDSQNQPLSINLVPPIDEKKRMSFDKITNDLNNNNDIQYSSKPEGHIISSIESERRDSTIKQEQSLAYFRSDRSNPTSPNHSNHSNHSNLSDHSLGSPRSHNESTIDDDRLRKKRRVSICSNKIKATNNPEVLEQVRNTLKLKQQQKAIIEARQQQQQMLQQQQQNYVDRRHSVAGYSNTISSRSSVAKQGMWDSKTISSMSKRDSVTRVNRNSRNLSVFTPPYNDPNFVSSISRSAPSRQSITKCSLSTNSIFKTTTTQVQSASRLGVGNSNLASISPITRSSNRQSISRAPLSTSSVYRTTTQAHSASTSASISGLISPQNVDDTLMPSPKNSSTVTSPTLALNNNDQPTKESFVHLFDNLYDTVSDTHSLKSTLEDQIRKTATLLQTLQASGSMIESLVRGHFREMQREIVQDMMVLEKRIGRVEECMRHNTTTMNSSPPMETDRRLSNISNSSSDIGYSHRSSISSSFNQINLNESSDGSSQFLSVRQQTHVSPPLSASSPRSNEETRPQDYQDMLSALKARLDSLERRMSIP